MSFINIFEAVINMSLTSLMLIPAVLIFRLLLSHAPKRLAYILWLVVLVRLVAPITIESRLGFFPAIALSDIFTNNTMKADISDSLLPDAACPNTGIVLPGFDIEQSEAEYNSLFGNIKILSL